MQLTTQASIDIPRPRDAVFDFSCACDSYVRLFRARGPVAGVVKAEMIGGAPLATGARRRMELSDGAVLEEELVHFDRPTRHCYRWSGGLRAPAKLLVRSGEGDWTFHERDGGTHIDWGYRFALTTPLVYPAAAIMIRQFRRWMEQQLDAIKAALTG